MHDFQQKAVTNRVPCDGVFVVIFFKNSVYLNIQLSLLLLLFEIPGIIKVSVTDISLADKHYLDFVYSGYYKNLIQ